MRWVGALVCCVAAYRLAGTPLQMAAVALACASVVCTVVASLTAASRVVTGLQHVLAALGGFFLFVSFAMR